jgi:hypothetical protein
MMLCMLWLLLPLGLSLSLAVGMCLSSDPRHLIQHSTVHENMIVPDLITPFFDQGANQPLPCPALAPVAASIAA